MHKGRVEAFSDGVLAIILTIMVLELKVPHGDSVRDLAALYPVFICYVLSFIYLGIYWNNHHHMFQVVRNVGGPVLWANLHLLFWLSLIPFTTGWAGENHFTSLPVAVYGFVLGMAGVAYYILAHCLVAQDGIDSPVALALGQDLKGKISVVIYAVAVVLAFYAPWLSGLMYVAVALLWLIPDRRFERVLRRSS